MKVVDVINPERVNRAPDKTVVLLSSGSFVEQGFTAKILIISCTRICYGICKGRRARS